MKSVLFRTSIVVLIFAIGSIIGYRFFVPKNQLKIYSAKDLNPKLVGLNPDSVKGEHHIGDFKLINQIGETVTPNNFKNKIYVADFIFTTCPGICPVMTSNLSRVYQQYKNDPKIAFISHSVMPETDSVPVLFAYAKKYDANPKQWHFVTGNKSDIYTLARKHYFAAITEGDGGPDDFVHTENLILVDSKKRIRGIYDGTSFDEVDQLIKDIEILKDSEE